MKIRKITSLVALLSFVLILLTSIILYIVPQGRVAYWSDWHLWGLSKTEWGNLHINLGLLLLLSICLHIYYNWKPITSYLKNRSRQLKILTPDFNAAFAVTIIFILGTYFLLPPFSWVLSLSESIKETAAEKYGEPPYGHAELSSLKTFTKKMNLDPKKSMALLGAAGITVAAEDQTLADIGRKNQISPQQIYLLIASAAPVSATAPSALPNLPDSAPPGTGSLTLADFCARYNLNLKTTIRFLKKQSLEAEASHTIKKIASANQLSPTDIYEKLKEAATGS